MKFNGTSLFFLFVLCLGAGTYYLEVIVPEQKEAQEKAATTVVSLLKDQVNFIKIQREGASIELQKGPEGWSFLTPLKDIADNDAVDGFLNDILDQRATETAKEGSGIDWKTFSLDKPKAIIELKNSAGTSIQVAIGNVTNFEGKLYLRRNNEDKVLIGENRWQSIGDKALFDFRDKRLLRGRTVSVDEIRWSSNKNKDIMVLNQKDNQWTIQESSFKLDLERIKSFLNWIQDSRISEYLSESGLNNSLIKEKKLGSPEAHLQLKLKDKIWEANFYKNPEGSYYAALSEPQFFLKLNALEIEKLLKVNRDYFRDHKEPFNYSNENTVKSISFESPLKKWNLELIGGEWKWAADTAHAEKEVDQEKVKGMLAKLRNLEVDEFLGSKKWGQPLENKMILRDEKGKEIQNFQWGLPFKKKVDKEEKSFFTIQTALLKESVAVEASHFDGITVHDIFKDKTSPPPPGPKDGKNGGGENLKIKSDSIRAKEMEEHTE